MNVEHLTQVRDWLMAGAPEREFNMDIALVPGLNNWCNTTCCIAGYVVTTMMTREQYAEKSPFFDIFEEARRHLGLDYETSHALFHPRVKGSSFSLDNHPWHLITAEQAAQAVQNVIDHNDPLWKEIL